MLAFRAVDDARASFALLMFLVRVPCVVMMVMMLDVYAQSHIHCCARSRSNSSPTSLFVRCSIVLLHHGWLPSSSSSSFTSRRFSTEPALQNSANPELPSAPLARPAPANPDGSVVASEKVERLCADILSLNMLELHQLLKVLKTRLGLTDDDLRGAAVVAGGGAPAAAAVEEEKAPEKEFFDLKLMSFDEKSKIKVIKEVRGISGLGLKEAKELVEGAPKVIKKGLKKDEAEKLVEKLKEVGAKVELD